MKIIEMIKNQIDYWEQQGKYPALIVVSDEVLNTIIEEIESKQTTETMQLFGLPVWRSRIVKGFEVL